MIYGKYPFDVLRDVKSKNVYEDLYKGIMNKDINELFLKEIKISDKLKELFYGIF